MNLSKEIITHVSKEAQREWEKCGKAARKNGGCPSCDLEKMTREKRDYIDNPTDNPEEKKA
jgi:hypothetical protein